MKDLIIVIGETSVNGYYNYKCRGESTRLAVDMANTSSERYANDRAALLHEDHLAHDLRPSFFAEGIFAADEYRYEHGDADVVYIKNATKAPVSVQTKVSIETIRPRMVLMLTDDDRDEAFF